MNQLTTEQRLEFLEATAIANIRDFFATSALSILANDVFSRNTPSEIARTCYRVADAMMIEREG